MALLSLTVNNASPAQDKKFQEVALIARALAAAAQVIQSNGGLVTSGNILGDGAVVLGTFTYTPQAGS
jgi:hypothetical protein